MIKMNKETAVIYARVSTEDQDYDRQIIELKAYAKALNFDVVAIAAEKLSGAKQAVDRPELDALLQKVRAEEVKHILVWDLSRLSRNVADTLAIVEVLNKNCCCLHIKDLNIKTLDKDCKPDAMAQMFITMLAAVAAMERKNIRSRMESGYKHHLATGGKVGRSIGYKKPIESLKYFSEIKRNLKASLSLRSVQAVMEKQGKAVSLGTIVKVKQYLKENKLIA